MSELPDKPAARKGSLLMTVRAVACSFFGVRRSSGYAQDLATLNPVHLVIAAIVGAGLFVAALLLLVQWVVASGVAS